MASRRGEYKIEIYPVDGILYLGTIKIDDRNYSNPFETVIILDQSTSMGYETTRFTNKIIPLVRESITQSKSMFLYNSAILGVVGTFL